MGGGWDEYENARLFNKQTNTRITKPDPLPAFFCVCEATAAGGGLVPSLTTRDSSPNHRFGEVAFQSNAGTDIYAIAQDPFFTNSDDLYLRRKGSDLFICSALSSVASDVKMTWSGTKMRWERSGAYPLEFSDLSQALPAGLWRIVVSGNQWLVNQNTAAAGDFSSNTTWIAANSTGTQVVNLDVRTSVGFFATTPSAQLTVTGSRGGNAALANLITKLGTYGLIVDGSTA